MRIFLASLWLAFSLVVPAKAQFISNGGGGGGGSGQVQQYYVSSAGSDSNSGLSPTSPWLTIAKINSTGFPANAVINLMTNLTGCFNLSSTSNTVGPLTIQSYGGSQVTVTCGAASQNFGNNLIGHMFDGISGIAINNIKFTNPNADAGTFTWVSTANPNYQMGILFQNSANSNPISITFTNNTVTGYSNEVAFMYPSAQSNWATCGAGFNGVTITGNTIGGTSTASHDVAGVGFYGTPSSGGGGFCQSLVSNFAQNITISNNTFQFLEGSSTENNNFPFASTGIMIGHAQNVTISNNYIHDIGLNMTANCPGPQGTWTGYDTNITWKNNEIARVGGLGATTCDNAGVNIGGQTFGAIFENNFVHDTNGGGIYLQSQSFGTTGPGWSATVANNIVENARSAAILTLNINDAGMSPALIYNNTLILSGGQSGFGTSTSSTKSNPAGSKFENNIVYAPYLSTLGSIVGFVVQTPDATNTTFDYNDYFVAISPTSPAPFKLVSTTQTTIAGWRTACTCDSHSVFADPALITEPVIFDGYNLHDPVSVNCSVGLAGPGACPIQMNPYTSSSAAAAGLAGLAGNPATDYYGVLVPTAAAPSMGANQTLAPKTNITNDAAASATGTVSTLSLTTAGLNETIFAGVVSNGAASCTIADGSALTWTLLGQGGSGTSIVTAWEAFSAAKQTADTITFTCTSNTFLQTSVMAFRGMRGIHDTAAGLPVVSATSSSGVNSMGADGVIVGFGRSTAPLVDPGWTFVQNGNSTITEFYLFNAQQLGVIVNGAAGNAGTIADIWH